MKEQTIWDVEKLMGLKQLPDLVIGNKSYVRYNGIVGTGKFDAMYDYGAGILEVSIRNNPPALHAGIAISTTDDGVWHSFGDVDNDKIHTIAKDFIATYGKVLPTEYEFNEFLTKYGLYGMFTG
jgi:hypothetical protein